MARTERFGIDLSSNNDYIDILKVRTFPIPIEFAWARDGESWGWKDPKFDYFRDIFEIENIWFGAYHILYPAQPAKDQFNRMIANAGLNLPGYAWDVELIHGMTPARIRETLRICLAMTLDKGLPAWVYTSPLWFNSYVMRGCTSVPEEFLLAKWWLAKYPVFPQGYTGYTEHPGPVDNVDGIPSDLVYIQQTTSSLPGKDIGQPSGSPRLDGNRELRQFFPKAGEPEPPVPPVLTVKTKEFEIGLTKVDLQAIRKGPGTEYESITRTLYSGREIPILSYSKDKYGNPWVEVGPNLWSAQKIGSKTYIEQVMG